MKHKFIAIEGNIGVGKTTLAQLLSSKLGISLILENFENNYFLPLFYNDMTKYGLHVELSFLVDRLEELDSLSQNELVVSDYFFSKTLLFAKNNLDIHAYKIFERVYKKFEENAKKPNLIIYLKRDTDELIKNIEKRGRKIERKITAEYLKSIEGSYEKHFVKSNNLKILSLDISGIDFNKDSDKLEKVIQLIENDYKFGMTNIRINN